MTIWVATYAHGVHGQFVDTMAYNTRVGGLERRLDNLDEIMQGMDRDRIHGFVHSNKTDAAHWHKLDEHGSALAAISANLRQANGTMLDLQKDFKKIEKDYKKAFETLFGQMGNITGTEKSSTDGSIVSEINPYLRLGLIAIGISLGIIVAGVALILIYRWIDMLIFRCRCANPAA